ncbi:hypothetical protein [Nonomuraea sp. NPDC003201]
MPIVVQLPTGQELTARAAADGFLDALPNLNTVRAYAVGAARLLPRLLKGRTRGPVFVTHRYPGPSKVVSPHDVCPATGLARLSYGQARALLNEHTALGGPGTGVPPLGVDPLGEAGACLLTLMAESRHKKPEKLRRYFKPSSAAIAEITSLLAPRSTS